MKDDIKPAYGADWGGWSPSKDGKAFIVISKDGKSQRIARALFEQDTKIDLIGDLARRTNCAPERLQGIMQYIEGEQLRAFLSEPAPQPSSMWDAHL